MKIVAALCLICGFTLVIYSNIYQSPFIFDDIHSIEKNEFIKDVSNFFTLKALKRPRALVDFTFAINYKLGGLNVFGYHLTNVAIHILNGFIVFFLSGLLIRALGLRDRIAKGVAVGQRGVIFVSLCTALIFVSHPLQTQAVTYIVQRYASLSAMFYMASVFFYIKARLNMIGPVTPFDSGTVATDDSNEKTVLQRDQKRKDQKRRKRSDAASQTLPSAGDERSVVLPVETAPRPCRASLFMALALLCGIAALMSKQTAASLPLAIIMTELLLFYDSWRKKGLRFTVAVAVIGALFLCCASILVFYVVGGVTQFAKLLDDVSESLRETDLVTRWQYLCTQFNVIVYYLRFLVWPEGQNLDHLYHFKTGFFDGLTPLAFLFLLIILTVGIISVKKRPIISFSIFWFFLALSVESSIFPIKDAMFEHRIYLPLFGFALLIGYLLFSVFRYKPIWATTIALVIALSLGSAAYSRNGVWKDDITLWTDVLKKSPDSLRAHSHLGRALANKGRFNEALDHYRAILNVEPENPDTLYNIGGIFLKVRQLDKAIEYCLMALKYQKNYADARYNLGTAYFLQGNYEKAAGEFGQLLKLRPRHIKGMNNLGASLAQQGKYDEAAGWFRKALKLDPANEQAIDNTAKIYMFQNRPAEALEQFLALAELQKGGSVELAYTIAALYGLLNSPDQSLLWLRRAVNLGFRNWEYLRKDKRFGSIANTEYYKSLIRQ